MIVVLDTNIVASATYWRGKPAHCLEAWMNGKFDLAISHSILSEYEEILDRLGACYPNRPPTGWLAAIKQAGHFYLPAPIQTNVADPDDRMFVECAVAAKADYLVTGDKGHLLPLKTVGGTKIIAVSSFLQILGVPENPS
jgi:putative PIN family toxin of toxin-antitoxin system